MQIDPNSNPWFIPSAAPQGTSELDHLNKGLYAYVNAAHDPELKKQADSIFGRSVPFNNSETQATLIGRAWCSRSGYLADPLRYCRDNKLPLPPNWSGENAQLYTLIGQNYIGKAQEHFNNQKAAREKALADAQKDYTETMGELPSLLAKSIRSAGGEKGSPLTPQYLEKLTKYGAREDAIQSQHRAATAWMYMSAYMDNIDSMQGTGRDKLLDIANTLSNEKGELDPHATAAFLMMMEDKATELQSTDSQFWADFADKFQNFMSRTEDQIGKAYTNKGKGWNSSIINPSFIVSTNPELDPNWLASQDNEPDPTYNDPRVEQLYGYMQRAINTAIAPSEKAEWYAKLLSEMGGLVGESAIPMALGIAASAATAGAGAGAFLAATAGYGAGFAATAPSTINASIAEAYAQGKVNPELYGTLEGIGQAAAENIGGPATSLKLFTKTAGKLTNWAASRTAGSRFLANQYARTTLNYLTAGAFESLTELGEEELGGYIGSRLNALAREMGATVSPQAYKLGETLSNMKAHEVAAIFGYSYALGLWGIPANYRSARTFARNTDNLLKAGHTPDTARDIQHRAFQTEDKIADIAANPTLTPDQKAEAIRKEEQDFCIYQQNKFNSEVLSDPNLRSRLEKEGRSIRDEAEVALDIEHEADLQILKDHGILQAVIIPGQKYQLTFLEQGETKEDGTRAPGKITTQEWSRTQLTNWLMLQKNTRIEQDLRNFNSLLLAHAHAQSATPEQTKTHFQNLGANRPLAALGELHKRGITPDFFKKAAQHALALQTQHENAGMSPQQAAQQPHPDFVGLSLGEVQNLSTDAATRQEQELATTGQLQSLTPTTNIEYGALNILRRDGTGLIKYVAGKANLLDLLEERFEIDIKQRTRGNKQLADQLAQTLLHIQSHLPGNIRLLDPAKKGRYTQSDFVEAYSKIAIGNFLLNQQNLPINPAGHRLVRNIARAVDTTRMFQTIGNAWLAYANSPEGKAHLAESGHSIADIMREAGFTFSNQIAQARATADQRTEVLQASNWQPAIEDELDALLEDIEAEEQLAEINQQEAQEPTTIPASESITGQEIVIEPTTSEDTTVEPPSDHGNTTSTPASDTTSTPASNTATTPTSTPAADLSGAKATTIISSLRNLIAKGKARAEHFAITFREIPGLTEAQAIEQGIRPLTQRGTPTAAYTQGRILAERCTDVQYLLLKSGKLTQKAKRNILGAPKPATRNPAWPKIAKKSITPAEQRLTIIKALQNAIDSAHENPRYHLNYVRHIIANGREYYVATDGRRLSVIEHPAPKGSKNLEESLDKNGNPVKDATFPESWRQVMIALTNNAQPLDLAPFRYLETYPKTAQNYIAWQDSEGKLSKYNPGYIGKGIKLFSTLSKAIGNPSTIQVDNVNMGPMLWHSEHNGWTAKYLLMPVHTVSDDIIKDGDILLNPQPSSSTNFSIKISRDIIQAAISNKLKQNRILPLCSCPVILPILGEKNVDVVTEARTLRKIGNQHHLSADEIYSVIQKLDHPEYVFKDTDESYIFIPGVIAKNDAGKDSDVETPIKLERTKNGEHYLASAYPLEHLDKIKSLLDKGKLVYVRTKNATPNTNGVPAVTQDFERLVRGSGFNDNILTEEDIVNYNFATLGISDSFTAAQASDLFTDGTLQAENAIVTQPDANFSIKPAAAATLDRFTVDPLGERIIHHIRTESRRYARLLGDKTPYQQAVNAVQSAASIISAVDKFLHTPGKPVPARYRRQLQKLRSIAEKYAQIISSGTPRSFNKISPQEKEELEAAIRELEAQELETATTQSDQLLTDSGRLTKRERTARQKEHHRAIVRAAAKGRVYQTLAAMLDTTADALDSYLKHQLLTKLDRLTATVKIKRTPGKRLKGKMTAPAYRELERAINLMALSDRAYQDEVEAVITAHETLANAINKGNANLTSGNALLIQLAQELTTSGQQVTPQTLTAALTNHEAALKIYGNVGPKNYEQTRRMANALFHLIRTGRNQWQTRHEQREANIRQYLQHFLDNTTATQGKANAIAKALEKHKWLDTLSLNSTMNAAQTILALASYEPLRPLMQDLLANYSTASVARQKHLENIRKQELYTYGRILGINPATEAGYSDKQLKEISKKFDTFYAENNQRITSDISINIIEEDGTSSLYTLELTKWEALNLILTYRQEHYKPNAEIHGFTDDILARLEKFIGQNLMDYGNAMPQILINDGTIPVYEEREGIPMRENPLYWPGHLNLNTLNTTRDEPLVNPYHPAASHDFLHARVRNLNEARQANAFHVFRKAIADRANYIYADPVTSTIESLLARQAFANRLQTLVGPGLARQLKTVVREIKGAAWQETALQDIDNKLVATAISMKSLSTLSGNPLSLARQFSAVANAGLMPGISVQDFYLYALRLKQDQSHISISEILQLDSFKTRHRDNAYVNDLLAMSPNAKFSTIMDITQGGMNLMDELDLRANAFSAAIVYNHKYDQLRKLGTLTEQQIRQRCEQEVAIYTKLLAQPLNRTDKSALYWQLGNHAIGRALLFLSSEAINKLGMMRANYIINRNQGRNILHSAWNNLSVMGVTVGAAAAITEVIIAILTGNTPDDDDSTTAWALATWLNAAYGQYLGALPIIGGISDTFLSPYGSYLSNPLEIPGRKAISTAGKLTDMLTDDKEYSGAQWQKETTRFMRELTATLGYVGGAYAPWQTFSTFAAYSHALTTALNALYPIAQGVSNDAFYADLLPDWYTQTGTGTRNPRKTTRPKSLIEQWLTPAAEESPRRATSRSSSRRTIRRQQQE